MVAGMGGVEPPMRESKSRALPLGDTPISKKGSRQKGVKKDGVGDRSRTDGLQSHNLAL
jgi:hypothetical protein